MTLHTLRTKIEAKEARLAVIGLGYVGLPVACAFADAGFDVLGVDIQPARIQKINQGISPIEGNEPGLAELLEHVVAQGQLSVTEDYSLLAERDVIFVNVETPVDENHVPQYDALRSVMRSLGPVLHEGALVIIESTIAPRTMNDVVRPLLEQSSRRQVNKDFYLGNCPERVMPGKLLSNLRSLSRVVGGMTPETAEIMVVLYRYVVAGDLDPVDCITAELVKATENAYRDVQIAFANEVALICEAVGGDVWKVRELVNKSPSRDMHLPGAGVGGHCIPKDPWLLAYGVNGKDVPLRIIPASRLVNDLMPEHIADLIEEGLRAQECEPEESRILVLGYAYLEESDDIRNSPSAALVQLLGSRGMAVVIHDPYVAEYQSDWESLALESDAAVIMVKHQVYRNIDLMRLRTLLRTPILVDGRGIVAPQKAFEAGLNFLQIGVSN